MAHQSSPSSKDLEDLCRSCCPESDSGRASVSDSLQRFIEANENPSSSPNFRSNDCDPVGCFLDLLSQAAVQKDANCSLLLLKVLKIVSRKQVNRLSFGDRGLRVLLLTLSPPLNLQIAAEGANVVLNICYEKDNVLALVRTPGIKLLLTFLAQEDADLQANAAGAVQSICFQPQGRKAVREQGGIPVLLDLLSSGNCKVVSRAVGAVHNISSDAASIRIMRKHGGVTELVRLLDAEGATIAGSAAGALQNVSRELASRILIRDMDAVPPLARLLSSMDLQTQVCASGALLNILGPELDPSTQGPSQRRGLGKLMSLIMATSIVYATTFEQAPHLA